MPFIILFFLLFLGCQKIDVPREEFGKFFGCVGLAPGNYFAINGTLYDGDTLYVGFSASDVPVSKFFIANEENFNKWKNGENAQFLVSYDNISDIDNKFGFNVKDNYYIVIVNGSQKQRVFVRIKKP